MACCKGSSIINRMRKGSSATICKAGSACTIFSCVDEPVVALICGGGNGAHVIAGLGAAQKDVTTRVLSLYEDEAERWNKAMESDGFTVSCQTGGGKNGKDPIEYKEKPQLVTKDPKAAVKGADIVIFVVPAFAHTQYLEALKPHVKPGTVIVGLPGQAGFEFDVIGVFGAELASQCTVMSFESLPWACRLTSFGSKAEVLGTKASLAGAINVGYPAPLLDPYGMLQKVLGPEPALRGMGHLVGISLLSTNGYLHPSIMYGRWHEWNGEPLDNVPLFYHGIDEESAKVLEECSNELLNCCKAVMKQKSKVKVNTEDIHHWYKRCYGDQIEDKSTLESSVKTNAAYKGLTHPCKEADDGKFVPDFKNRYLTEDIPFGLAVMKGIAEILEVETPTIDKVIMWAQGVMGKEYLVDGKLTGSDVKETRSPQKYGLTTLDAMLGLS